MKLQSTVERSQPDPFIFQDGDTFYIYVTAQNGVEAYSAKDIFGLWKWEGVIAKIEGANGYWAPCVIKIDETYYLYFSCVRNAEFEYMYVMKGSSPLGPFTDEKKLFEHFSIDPHVVQTKSGLFLIYSIDDDQAEYAGTRIMIDRLLDPYTPAYRPEEKVSPTLKEEMNRKKSGEKPWYTIEGGFWFEEGGWQYLMYSGAAYETEDYHIGYCAAKTTESDLTKVAFTKRINNGKFAPVMIKNTEEEGTGHHSVIRHNGEYYIVYHARDYNDVPTQTKPRTMRIARLVVKDGSIVCPHHGNQL